MDVLPPSNGQLQQPGHVPLSLVILYCGKMGTAILHGLVSATLRQREDLIDLDLANATSTPVLAAKPIRISHISVIVRRAEEVSRIRAEVSRIRAGAEAGAGDGTDQDLRLNVSAYLASPDDTTHAVRAARTADIILLCCKPYMYQDVLGDAALQGALFGGPRPKVLISVLGGVSTLDLQCCLGIALAPTANPPPCTVVRVIPNLAARIHQSMTVVAAPRTTLEEDAVGLVARLFSILGAVRQLPEQQFDMASALASSAIAFQARLIASAARGNDLISSADYDGDQLSPADALWIAAHAARGASSLILDGDNPDDIVNQVTTKGGSTEVGLQIMWANKVEDTMASAILGCAQKIAKLGTNTKS